jgi:hypothetical protein
MDNALLSRIVATANLAPSVHNTQPARCVADHGPSAEICSRHFAIPSERRLINVLRARIAGAVPKRARLSVQQVIV